MRIIDLIREAVPPAKPLQILPQGVQTPPPAKPAAPAAAKPAPAAAPAAGTPNLRPTATADYRPAPAATAGNPAAFGVVDSPANSAGGVVSKAALDQYRIASGNPKATLGQYMNQQQGKTFRKGGANDPAVIAARQKQPVGPAVGSQAQTASGKNELDKFNIAANKPPAVVPAAPAPAAPAPAAPVPNSGSAYTSGVGDATNDPVVVSRNDGVPPPLPAEPAAAPNSGSDYTGGVGNVQDFGVRGTPILPYGQGSPVSGTTNAVTRTDAEIGDTNPRTGVVTPGSFDKNRAQGQKNLDSVKNFFGFNKPTPGNTDPNQGKVDYNTQTAKPITTPVNTDPNQGKVDYSVRTANPLRGVKESTGMQDPVLVRMQNLAGIRR